MNQSRKQRKAAAKPDNQAQSRAFIEKARELEADEEKSAADEILGKLAKREPDPHRPKK